MKKVFLIMGHPTKDSFSGKLADAYEKALIKKGYEVRRQDVIDLKFNLITTTENYLKPERDLIKTQNDIKWADEIIFFYPLWWGFIPALLKGYIDRVFIPGFAYAYDENMKHSNYLKGKTMRVFSTCDADENTVTNMYKNADFIIFNDNMCHFLGMEMKQMIRVDTLYAKNESERKKIIEEIVSKIE